MKKYSLYIFDMDLTTIDSAESSSLSYEAAFNSLGLPFDKSKVYYYLNQNLDETYQEVESLVPGKGKAFFDAFVENSGKTFHKVAKFYPECEEVFKILYEQGAKLAMVTNRNAHDIKLMLDAYPNIGKYISYFVGSDMVEKLKPDPQGMNMCLSYFNINKKDAIYVGDSRCDYLASVNAGIDFAYINRYDNHAVSEVESFLDLYPLIRK